MGYLKTTPIILAILLFGIAALPCRAQMPRGKPLAGSQVSEILEKSVSGVVTVAVYKTDFAKSLLGMRSKLNIDSLVYAKALDLTGAKSSGSGFVVMHKGKPYIVTNAHVIENAGDGEGSLFAYSIDRSKYSVKVVGGDTFYDLAVLEFTQPLGNEVVPMRFRPEAARLGEPVYAIGNPLGEYPYTVTDGIISAKNRVRSGITGKFGFLQTTATLTWGNSGGPLVDQNGAVVGVNSQIAVKEVGGRSMVQQQINFALETAIAQRLFKDIIETGRVERAYFGLEFAKKYRQVTSTWKEGWEPLDGKPLLSGFIANSPADLQLDRSIIGSEVLAVNGEPVRNLEEVLGELEKVRPTDSVTLVLKDTVTRSVTLKGEALQQRQLESLAEYVLQTHCNSRVESPGALTISSFTKGLLLLKENKFVPASRMMDTELVSLDVLAAGVYKNKKSQNIYKSLSLSELGAAIKISGLYGAIDIYAAPSTDEGFQLHTMRYVLGTLSRPVTYLWY